MNSEFESRLAGFFDEKAFTKDVAQLAEKKFWRPNDGKTVIRILPPFKNNGEKLFFQPHKVHWVNGRPYECLNQTITDKDGNVHIAEKCPICEASKKLYGSTNPEIQKLSKSLYFKNRFITRIIVRNSDKYSKDAVFYEIPGGVKDMILSAIASHDFGSVISPIDGRDISLDKEGKGFTTTYKNSYIKPAPIAIADNNEDLLYILDHASKMSYNSLISFQDSEILKAAIMGVPGVPEALNGTVETKNPLYNGYSSEETAPNQAPTQNNNVAREATPDPTSSKANLNEMSDEDALAELIRRNKAKTSAPVQEKATEATPKTEEKIDEENLEDLFNKLGINK